MENAVSPMVEKVARVLLGRRFGLDPHDRIIRDLQHLNNAQWRAAVEDARAGIKAYEEAMRQEADQPPVFGPIGAGPGIYSYDEAQAALSPAE